MYILYGYAFCVGSSQILHWCPIIFYVFSISGSNNEMQANPENGGENQKVSFVVMAVSVFMGFLYIKH